MWLSNRQHWIASGRGKFLDNGKYGQLVPVGDLDAPAEAMQALINGTRPAAGQWLDQFREENVVDQYLAFMAYPKNGLITRFQQ